MGRKDDRGGGRRGSATASPSAEAEAEPLASEIRELHEKYGDAVDVPERLLDLARRVADAHEGLDQAGPPRGPGGRRRTH